jgi:xanthine dehydrogenase accessory factor
MVVFADGTTTGTVGGGKVEAAITKDALAALTRCTPGLRQYTLQDPTQGDPGICGGTMTVYLEPYMTPHTVFVIGAGHVGRAVIDLAHWLGYRTVAIDEREELLTPDAAPLLVNTPARYIGAMGSARRWESTRELLSGSGLSDDVLERIHNPIGIDIGAETVEEIAVSIMSEIIASNLNATT